jgi:pimeloyl-ACP methyl ester carboxylesterase
MPLDRARTRRAGGLLVATVLALAAAPASAQGPGDATDPIDEPLVYCDGTFDAGASGAPSDAEHEMLVGDPPLPEGLRERRVEVGPIATRVVEAGPAEAEEAVVFMHGNPGSSRDYDGLVAATGRFARAIAFDTPGFGRADDRRNLDYGRDLFATFANALLEQLGVRRVHLVLHDFAGPWGLHWAMRNPDALASALLLNTGVFIGYHGHPAALVWHTGGLGEADMATMTRQRFRDQIQWQSHKPLPSAFLDRMYDDFDRATRCAVLDWYRDVDDPDAMGREQAAALRPYRRPALVIWGARDPYIPVEVAHRQEQAFPGARVEILPDAGHWAFVDEPERVRELATEFLRGVVRGPRVVAAAARSRPGARSLVVRVRAEGARRLHGVRVRLLRGRRVLGASRRPVTVGRERPRAIRVHLRRPLRAGRYVAEVTARGVAPRRRVLRVR